jgi:transposase
MMTVETIGRIRRAYFVERESIRGIARRLRVSRQVVRRAIASETGEFHYERSVQPLPKLGLHLADLKRLLEENERRPRRERVTLIRMWEELRELGYAGGYDAVRRYARRWQRGRGAEVAEAYIPLSFAPGEAYQFDWSHEVVELAGMTTVVKVAHVRLCHSRMPFIRAYPREAQEMMFDAHDRAFAFFRGAARCGIYDNMKTAVDGIFAGKERAYNRRFLAMCNHHLVEPRACTPGAAHEKGQVENQVGVVRQRFFSPRLKVKSYAELNAYLLDRCVAHAKASAHPELKDKTVFDMFESEREMLIDYRGPFDSFRAVVASVSKTCLVCFDRNKYSVKAKAVGRPVDIHVYADHIVIRQDGEIVGEHARCFGRDQTVYDPWHYVPVLARKPGALRNGAPFKDWTLPASLEKVRRKLVGSPDGDRQMVSILTGVLTDGLPAMEAACREALEAGTANADVILNVLARRQAPPPPALIQTPESLRLTHLPLSNCARYDDLRIGVSAGAVHGAA